MPELSGVVRLGAPEDIGERLLPSILKSFAESYPGIMARQLGGERPGQGRRWSGTPLATQLRRKAGARDKYL